jgi:hypothetical protein
MTRDEGCARRDSIFDAYFFRRKNSAAKNNLEAEYSNHDTNERAEIQFLTPIFFEEKTHRQKVISKQNIATMTLTRSDVNQEIGKRQWVVNQILVNAHSFTHIPHKK